jgi:hypothetical protein
MKPMSSYRYADRYDSSNTLAQWREGRHNYTNRKKTGFHFENGTPHKTIIDKKELFLQDYSPNKEKVITSLKTGCINVNSRKLQ